MRLKAYLDKVFFSFCFFISLTSSSIAFDIPHSESTLKILSLNANRHETFLHQGSGAVIKGSDDGYGHKIIITARHVALGNDSNELPQNGVFQLQSWTGDELGYAQILSCDDEGIPKNHIGDNGPQSIPPSVVFHDSCLLRVYKPTKEYDELEGYQIDILADEDGKSEKGALVICQNGSFGDPGWGKGMSGGPLLNMEYPNNPKIVGVSSVITEIKEDQDNCAFYAPITSDIWEAVFHNTFYRGIKRLGVATKWRIEGFNHGEATAINTTHSIVNTAK